jgi:hypothetical protein
MVDKILWVSFIVLSAVYVFYFARKLSRDLKRACSMPSVIVRIEASPLKGASKQAIREEAEHLQM